MAESSLPNPSPDSASLVRRLAGASVTKAGLNNDQSEINRIIAEASKGSKFYENEKRKDKELSERIERILKQRDEVLQGVNIRAIEKELDHTIEVLESQRDLSQYIVHVDMDAFFANVELLDDPSLAGKPFGVGGGVMSTASYEARKFGVRSGMPTFIAKKLCPDLIVVYSHYARYNEMSNKVMSIFRRYDPTMYAAGCDEGYLNITKYCREHNLSPDACVQEIRETVQKETQLTVSAGIAPNKMLAKICSDKNKPNGQFHLEFEPRVIKDFMKDLSIRKVPGVGRVNERLLEAIGIHTCGDIIQHRAALYLMDKQFGLNFLLNTHLGIASNVVQPITRDLRKSIGAERTFSPISDRYRIFAQLEDVCAELEEDMDSGGWTGKTVTLKFKLDTFQVFTRAKSFDRWVSSKKEDLFAIGKELLIPELPVTIRLIGLRVTKLKDLREKPSSENGIKRFFESAPSSPRKRQRLDSVRDDPHARVLHQPMEDAMPGFHEEEDMPLSQAEVEDGEDLESELVESPAQPVESSRRAPVSAPSRMASSKASAADSLEKKRDDSSSSTSRKPTSACRDESEPTEGLTCPICQKMLATDNQGLNAHIDFCLSKSAIAEAQANPQPESPLRRPRSRTPVDTWWTQRRRRKA